MLELLRRMEHPLTSFQRQCVASLEGFLKQRETEYQKRIGGKKETYAILSFENRSHEYEVYVYEDEMGYSEDDSWKIWEAPVYDSESELFEAFMADLQASYCRRRI